MGHIEKRSGGYRVRYHDPLGRRHSETFNRKIDAERFLREMEVEIDRGRWLDPRGAEMPLGTWAEEFLSLARRLAPTTQDTYRRDLAKYILPRFAAYRIGRLPADEIENWLMDEVAAGVAPSSPSQPERTRRRSRRAWATRRSTSPSTATAICSPSSTRRSRRHSVSGSSRSRRAGRRTSSTRHSRAEPRSPRAGARCDVSP